MIKYDSAYNSLKEIVNIKDIDKTSNQKDHYTCISCENELIPKLGKSRKHHFAHKVELTCSPETYLHKLGKRLFFEEYSKCLEENKPFFIELHQNRICNKCEIEFDKICNIERTTKIFDLTKYFDQIQLEVKEANFIPDLMLSGTQTKEKIFVEIAVTHSSSIEKILSGYKIIEFKINKENDLDVISSRNLSVHHPLISFQKFSVKDIKGSMYDGYCEKTFDLFVVFSNGKSFLQEKSLSQIKHFLNDSKESLLYCQVSTSYIEHGRKYKSLIANAYTKDIRVKNCFICRYHAVNSSSTNKSDPEKRKLPIFCKYLKEMCSSNDAANCQFYRPDNKYILEYQNVNESRMERVYRELDGYNEEILFEKIF